LEFAFLTRRVIALISESNRSTLQTQIKAPL
jgi:hypothetical protein